MASAGSGTLLRQARKRAGLSQRALARRARTAQSVVARIESGDTNPSYETLLHLVQAAGFELHTELTPRPSGRTHMLDDVPRILSLSPQERLVELRNAARLLEAARPVGK